MSSSFCKAYITEKSFCNKKTIKGSDFCHWHNVSTNIPKIKNLKIFEPRFITNILILIFILLEGYFLWNFFKNPILIRGLQILAGPIIAVGCISLFKCSLSFCLPTWPKMLTLSFGFLGILMIVFSALCFFSDTYYHQLLSALQYVGSPSKEIISIFYFVFGLYCSLNSLSFLLLFRIPLIINIILLIPIFLLGFIPFFFTKHYILSVFSYIFLILLAFNYKWIWKFFK